MAGFEVIVRPVVFPNIRPQPTRSLPPVDDPTQGQAVLSGGGGQVIALTHSYSASASSSGGRESERVFDTARVYQQDDATGEINKSNYVDVEVVKKITTRDETTGLKALWYYEPTFGSGKQNVEFIRTNETRKTP